jgi:hypothetical protein
VLHCGFLHGVHTLAAEYAGGLPFVNL